METSASYTDKTALWFSSDERRWINRIRMLNKKYPDQVIIVKEPEENDGCIYAKLPVDWMKINPKRASNVSEEQRFMLIQRLRAHQNSPE